jgi:amidase
MYELTALAQAAAIRHKQISPLELTEMYLDRIASIDGDLGSFVTVCGERAMDLAARQTELLVSTPLAELPPFFGVPIGIKDLNPVAGIPCGYGVAAMKGYIPDYSDGIVTTIERAGFNILGKTATSELASFPYTEPVGANPCRNPHDRDYTSGGSSGGAAAAVAANLIPLAQGSDGGGSLRGPVHCCGLVGIKPTRGRVSDAPAGDRISGLAAMGPIARNLPDAAALLDIIAHPIAGDPYLLPQPKTSFLAAVDLIPPRLRIGMCMDFSPFGRCCPAYANTVTHAGSILADLGHDITEISIDVSTLIDAFTTVWSAGVATARVPAAALSPLNQYIISKSGTAGEYLQSIERLQVWVRQFAMATAGFDVLLLPVYMHETIKVGAWADLSPADAFDRIANWIVPCPIFNATGQPVITLPAGRETDTNLPIGIQLAGKLGTETLLISLAARLLEAMGES